MVLVSESWEKSTLVRKVLCWIKRYDLWPKYVYALYSLSKPVHVQTLNSLFYLTSHFTVTILNSINTALYITGLQYFTKINVALAICLCAIRVHPKILSKYISESIFHNHLVTKNNIYGSFWQSWNIKFFISKNPGFIYLHWKSILYTLKSYIT